MSKPNILWISNHDSSAWNYGCYGDKYAHTPNIDRLAAESALHQRVYHWPNLLTITHEHLYRQSSAPQGLSC